jgi:hypothetical protein
VYCKGALFLCKVHFSTSSLQDSSIFDLKTTKLGIECPATVEIGQNTTPNWSKVVSDVIL